MTLQTRVLVTLIALTAAVGVIFALWPGLDLTVSHYFYDDGGFIGASRAARLGRDFFRVTPFLVLAAFVIQYFRRRDEKHGFGAWSPDKKAVIFLVASIAIGSGLIVNLGMKDHLHRPRPVQTIDFGGKDEFRPWYRFDGGCDKNCGFPSGEASSGFWMVAPAMLVPPPFEAVAVAGAFAFGVGASVLRLAFGGHYLSDVLMGGLISLIVVFAVRRLVWPRGAP